MLFLLTAWGFYSIFRTEETCMDKIKNQNEEDVDCGGVCSPCKKIQTQDLSVGETGIVPSGISGQYDFYVIVINPNNVFGSNEFHYEVVLKDNSGNIVAQRSGTSFILPGESKYITESNIVLDDPSVKIEFKVSDPKWMEFTEYYEKPNLKIVNKNYNEVVSGVGFSEAKGLLKNESPFDFSLIKIRIILRDTGGKIVALNSTEMRTVKSQEERDFRAFWPSRFPGEVRSVETQIEVNVFDSESFIKRYFKTQRFQQYD